MPDQRYLKLFGTLRADNRLELIPGYLSERSMPRLESPTPPIQVELLGENDRLLLKDMLFTARYCRDGVESDDLLVRGAVPFPDGVRQVRFSCRGVELLTIPVSRAAPQVKLRWRPSGLVRGRQTIKWEASHPEGSSLQFFLRYSTNAGRSWNRLTGRLVGNEHLIDFDLMPGGEECCIAVVATDGVNTTNDASRSFRVALKPCQAFLLEPEHGQHFPLGRTVLLRGQGYYLEEQRPEREALLWTSKRDGELGRGTVVELKNVLSPGEHEITLQAGIGTRSGRQSICIYVDGPEHSSTESTGRFTRARTRRTKR
jgi:hypothetical protein